MLCPLLAEVARAIPSAWALTAIVFILGLIAVASPNSFSRTDSGTTWIDTSRLLAVLDCRVKLDHWLLRHSRLFGLLAMASSLIMAWVLHVTTG